LSLVSFPVPGCFKAFRLRLLALLLVARAVVTGNILPMSIIALRRSNCWSCWCSCSAPAQPPGSPHPAALVTNLLLRIYHSCCVSFAGALAMPRLCSCGDQCGFVRLFQGTVRVFRLPPAMQARFPCPTPVFFIEKLLLPISRVVAKCERGGCDCAAGEVVKGDVGNHPSPPAPRQRNCGWPRCSSDSSTGMDISNSRASREFCGSRSPLPIQNWLRFSSSRGRGRNVS